MPKRTYEQFKKLAEDDCMVLAGTLGAFDGMGRFSARDHIASIAEISHALDEAAEMRARLDGLEK